MSSSPSISAAEVIRLLRRPHANLKCLDVRSPGEFGEGAIPRFRNLPILNDHERHEVGLCYKQRGQAEAITLGHRLVDPEKETRIEAWRSYLGGAEYPLVACWRGGLRSRIACEWITGAGMPAVRVEGGYKEIRRALLAELGRLPGMLVIAGPTGARKSQLLRSLELPRLDLERHARHRGSAFGGFLAEPQPPQATFENELCLELSGNQSPLLLVEDESQMIGRLHLPTALKEKILASPVVTVIMPAEERVGNILAEYVAEPLRQGVDSQRLEAKYTEGLLKIQRKLGGLLTQEIGRKLRAAFHSGDPELHRDWIRDLLVHYYDGAYAYGLRRAGRPVAFSGDWNECRTWIQKRFA